MKLILILAAGVAYCVFSAPAALATQIEPGPSIGCTNNCGGNGPRYSIKSLTTKKGATLVQLGAIASCKNAGGTCTITKVTSKTTTVGVSFGLSKGTVAGMINASVSATNSTSVSCTSPKLKKGQIYRAYTRGISKSYRIKRVFAGHTDTSGTKHSYQPYKTSIECRVEND